MNHNVATLVGRLAGDPIVKSYTKADGTGGVRCFMRLAITRLMDRSKKIGDESRRTNFVPIVAWGKRGELCAQYLAKGTMITVTGEVIAESQLITQDGSSEPLLDANGRKQYRDFFYVQASDVQFGPRSLKNASPEQRQSELLRVQKSIDAASTGDSPAEASASGSSAPAGDDNPYDAEVEGAAAAA